VRRGSGLQNPSKGTFKKASVGHIDVSIVVPNLTVSREISQYGAFKRSIASVSTNNQSIRMSARRDPFGLRKRPVNQTPETHHATVSLIPPTIEPISKSI
jgi:hypothetical protein